MTEEGHVTSAPPAQLSPAAPPAAGALPAAGAMPSAGPAGADQELLREYVRSGSAAAFRGIVERYAGLVRASARRQVRDVHLSDDVTQAVFIVLARRAKTIHDAAVLPAWLIKTTYFASRDATKREARRRRHEQKAAEMTPAQTQPTDPTFEDLAPVLDRALARLKEVDRNLVTRRYLQQQPVEQIAVATKMTEAAVRKRLSRALPRLRDYLSRHGTTLSVAALAATLLAAPPAPADAATIASTATAALAAAEGATAGVTASAIAIASSVIFRLALPRLAAAALILIALGLIAGAGVALRGSHATSPSPAANPAAAVPMPIKIGFLVSDYTATGPGEDGVFGNIPQGFTGLKAMLSELNDDPQLDRYAILEPDTANKGQIPDILRQYFPRADHVIDGSKPDELRRLDVVACPSCINMRDEVMSALVTAVSGGVGLLNQGTTGCNHPGMSEITNQVNGMTRYTCIYFPDATGWDCDVANDSPLTRELSPMIGKRKLHLDAMLIGSIGALRNGTPILAAPGLPNRLNHRHDSHPVPPGTVYYPLYTAQLGEGRIVATQWNREQPTLTALTNGRFYYRTVRWLARRATE